jgi:hypothetical protein
MDCTFVDVSYTLNDLIMCTIFNMGISFDIFAIGVLLLFVIISMYARLDFDVSLVFAFGISYGLFVLSGSLVPSMLSWIVGILIVGIAVRILIGLIGIFRQ